MLAARAITRRFPPVTALDGVAFDVHAGEVHALMGGNGAGKSTLIRILGGALRPDSGAMTLDGHPFAPTSPADAACQGVCVVHQEIGLVPTLEVAEAILLGRPDALPRRCGLLDRRAMRSRARAALALLGVDIDVCSPLGALPMGQRQLVAIARALDMRARVLILDEPTSSLDRDEVDRLLAIVRGLRDRGTATIYITHFLDELPRVADRITVLRNGRSIGTWVARELSQRSLVAAMVGEGSAPHGGKPEGRRDGKRRSPQAASAVSTADGGIVPASANRPAPLSASAAGRPPSLHPFDLELSAGTVLGLAGLLGSGRTETLRLLFGADRASTGTIAVDGVPQPRWSPRRAIAAGVGLAPEDRNAEGLFLGMSVLDNIVMVAARGLAPLGLRNDGAERLVAALIAARVGLDPDCLHRPVSTLSGGNRQKVVLARWLTLALRVLLLDEPTRGIDVGAKAQIDRLIRELAAAGLAIATASTELDELLRQADRVRVLRDRRHLGTLNDDQLGMESLVAAIAEGDRPEGTQQPANRADQGSEQAP